MVVLDLALAWLKVVSEHLYWLEVFKPSDPGFLKFRFTSAGRPGVQLVRSASNWNRLVGHFQTPKQERLLEIAEMDGLLPEVLARRPESFLEVDSLVRWCAAAKILMPQMEILRAVCMAERKAPVDWERPQFQTELLKDPWGEELFHACTGQFYRRKMLGGDPYPEELKAPVSGLRTYQDAIRACPNLRLIVLYETIPVFLYTSEGAVSA